MGTQVVHAQLRRPVELTSLYDDLSRAKHEPRTTVLKLARQPAKAVVAEALHLEQGTEVLYLERVRFDGPQPLALMHNWLPGDLLDTTIEELESTGLYELLRRSGVHMRIANQRIGARGASATEARLLRVKSGAPLLTMERTTFNDSGRAIEYATHSYRADSYSFETTLVER